MSYTFEQVVWSPPVVSAAGHLVELALAEDVGDHRDWTTDLLVPADARGTAAIVTRQAGVVAGMPIVPLVLAALDADVAVEDEVADGQPVVVGQRLAQLTGSVRHLLTAERTILNFLGRLSGIASLTRQFVDAVADTGVQVYDTRKTTPGWRLLEKYAVRCGGGCNHRLGLDRAVMIKDNHVALAQQEGLTLVAAVDRVRTALAANRARVEAVEVEVDSLAQLEAVLEAIPDIVLLDNFSCSQLQQAVAVRDRHAPAVLLEASGGVTLATIDAIAATGIDRISVGALTHSAVGLDIGLDWSAGVVP